MKRKKNHIVTSHEVRSVVLLIVATALLILIPAAELMAEVYEYRDAKGGKHYVQDPADVPEPFRKSMKRVGGNLSVVGSSDSDNNNRKAAGFNWIPESPAAIVFIELFRSRLFFTMVLALLILLIGAFGLFLAIAIPDARDKLLHMLGLSAVGLAALASLWLGLAGPQTLRMLKAAESSAGKSISKTGDTEARQNLREFIRTCRELRKDFEEFTFTGSG